MLDGKLELTGGLRYFEDAQTTRENISSTGNPATPLVNGKADFHALTPRVVLTWHPQTELTAYASYSEGFRSGVVQNPVVQFIAPQFPGALPDRLHNYELGTKGNAWNGRVRFDAAAFFLDWQDVQQSLQVTPPGASGASTTAILNGPSASGLGAEFSVTVAPIDRLELGANVAWNDLRFDGDVVSGGTNVIFHKGDRLLLSPQYTLGANADYLFGLGNGFEGRFSVSGNYTPTLRGGAAPDTNGESILLAGTSFSVSAPRNWTAMLFVDNISNDTDAVIRFSGIPTWGGLNTRPRTYGLQVEYKF
jgi:outer membrane receptor protein involved in Fe transport